MSHKGEVIWIDEFELIVKPHGIIVVRDKK